MLSAEETTGSVQDTKRLSQRKQFGFNEAKDIGDTLGISWDRFCVEQFRVT
jgi:hypothetical protein